MRTTVENEVIDYDFVDEYFINEEFNESISGNSSILEYNAPESYFLASFDEDGRMQEFVLIDDMLSDEKKEQLLSEGWIEISSTDWKLYLEGTGDNNNGFIMKDGKPISAPEQSIKEKQQLIMKEYEKLIDELKIEYNDLMQEYQSALKEAENNG